MKETKLGDVVDCGGVLNLRYELASGLRTATHKKKWCAGHKKNILVVVETLLLGSKGPTLGPGPLREGR